MAYQKTIKMFILQKKKKEKKIGWKNKTIQIFKILAIFGPFWLSLSRKP